MNDDAVSLPSRSWARLPVASAAVTYLAFALPTSMLGVMWPDVRHRFHQPSGALGLVLLSYGISRMATALSGRRLSDAFGLGRSFIATLVVLMLVCLALAVSPSWLVFLLAVAGLGAVSGALDSLGAGFITAKLDGGVAPHPWLVRARSHARSAGGGVPSRLASPGPWGRGRGRGCRRGRIPRGAGLVAAG